MDRYENLTGIFSNLMRRVFIQGAKAGRDNPNSTLIDLWLEYQDQELNDDDFREVGEIEENLIYKTFQEWSDSGYKINKGSRGKWIDGICKFNEKQVTRTNPQNSTVSGSYNRFYSDENSYEYEEDYSSINDIPF